MQSDTLTVDKILAACAEMKATFEQSADPVWDGRIRENVNLTEPKRVKKNEYILVRKHKRLVWRRAAIRYSHIRVPSRQVYFLPDGSMVAHPETARAIISAAKNGVADLPDIKILGVKAQFRYPYFGFGGAL